MALEGIRMVEDSTRDLHRRFFAVMAESDAPTDVIVALALGLAAQPILALEEVVTWDAVTEPMRDVLDRASHDLQVALGVARDILPDPE